jgi:hypothetical protein
MVEFAISSVVQLIFAVVCVVDDATADKIGGVVSV